MSDDVKQAEQEKLDALLQNRLKIQPPKSFVEQANIKDYDLLYWRSLEDPDGFWDRAAKELHWFAPWDKVMEWNYPYVKWFLGGKTNIAYNCLDRHVAEGRKNKAALVWVGEEGSERVYTYYQLFRQTCRFANALRRLGVKKGDRVCIYMPLVPEQVIAMLACARIGAIHSIVYGGFSAPALKSRIEDAEAKVVITADVGVRRGKHIPLKRIVDDAIRGVASVEKVIVLRRAEPKIELSAGKELDFDECLATGAAECEPEIMDSEDPLFFLYTSGTTGQPKGVVHVQGGFMVGTYMTTKMVFDLKGDDIFWCSADPGWITGHSYIVYGPLCNGATVFVSEGAPDHPNPGRWWGLIEKYGVTVFYTAPTAIRMFMKHGEQWPKEHDLSTLRLLGTVGEPINPEAWMWYYRNIGHEQCPIVDTWWQTETGMILITTLPSYPAKPGRAGKPLPTIIADVVDRQGRPVESNKGGFLALKRPWPSMMRTIYKDPERYEKYWNTIPGWYSAGDVANKDEEGYIMVLGRADDVMNVSGHRIGTAEVESALVSHPAVAEAAVVGKPDPIKGEAIKAFVTLKKGHERSEPLSHSLKAHVRAELGAVAVPSEIEFVDALPKTRSGKIMRRVLKARELGKDPGDISTLEE
jgi:acetyl-CoA synthetase